MTKLDQVKARFGGKDRTFRIAREDLSAFELAAKEPSYALFRTLSAGQWTLAQVRIVIRFANLDAKAMASRRRMAAYGLAPGMERDDEIDAVLDRNPPAQYAMLAQAILGAALFGLDEADAIFTDEDVDA